MAIQAGQTADSGAGDVLLVPDGVSSPPVPTLDNYTYRGAGKGDAAIRYDASNPLTVVLVGNNSVTHAAGSVDTSVGFYSDYYADLTITGEGSLTVAGGNTNGRSYGVGSMGGSITISGGTVSATSDSAQYCAGIAGVGGVVISDAEVEATGGVATVTISDEAKVGGIG